MSPTIALVLDLVLVGLLVATIAYAIILNKQIVRLRDSRSEMADLIAGLNEAMTKAELGVRGMKRTASDTGEELQRTIDRGRALRDELQFMIEAADTLANRLGGVSNTERPPPRTAAVAAPPPAPRTGGGIVVRPAAAAAAAAIFRPHDADVIGDEPAPSPLSPSSRRAAEPPPAGPDTPREGEENLSRAERELLRALENRR
ncbi:DUF6468 domain-containing protein [Azospirillum halopraeferens]|uniref:DUF6468 domain-containing protein n=1 Tax=Azospirillum halopraeferens TaxID=34010 RepID=UPI00041C7176|nr:DUF6468 domain-containing protein [Azospirillum halopraeferens]